MPAVAQTQEGLQRGSAALMLPERRVSLSGVWSAPAGGQERQNGLWSQILTPEVGGMKASSALGSPPSLRELLSGPQHTPELSLNCWEGENKVSLCSSFLFLLSPSLPPPPPSFLPSLLSSLPSFQRIVPFRFVAAAMYGGK